MSEIKEVFKSIPSFKEKVSFVERYEEAKRMIVTLGRLKNNFALTVDGVNKLVTLRDYVDRYKSKYKAKDKTPKIKTSLDRVQIAKDCETMQVQTVANKHGCATATVHAIKGKYYRTNINVKEVARNKVEHKQVSAEEIQEFLMKRKNSDY
jgi:hypothetical protein